jgi:hypothetical protein
MRTLFSLVAGVAITLAFSGCQIFNEIRCPDIEFRYETNVYYPQAGSPRVIRPVGDYEDGVFAIENLALANGDELDVKQNLAGFDSRTGAFDVNNSVGGIKYTISYQPSRGCYKNRKFTTQVTIQGGRYPSGVFVVTQTNSIPPVYGADKPQPIPATGFGYNYIVQNDRQEVLLRGGQGTPNAVVSTGAALDVRRFVEFAVSRPPLGQPYFVSVDYFATDGNNRVASNLRAEVRVYRRRADVPPELLARANALATFSQGRLEESYKEIPPLIIIILEA